MVGSLLAVLVFGALAGDDYFSPWYPFLLLFTLALAVLGCKELLDLIPVPRQPHALLCHAALLAIIAANWVRPVNREWPQFLLHTNPWFLILGIVAAAFIAAFLIEMAVYREAGEATTRVALTGFVVIYLGVLASFLIQLRWLPESFGNPRRSRHALMLAIFVPKCCDIGAYCAGRLFGRHKMTPLLSPKKNWEGAVGGLLLGIVTAIFGSALGAQPEFWVVKAVGFGITVGIAGMLGDLAESLVKREGQRKDASQSVPGFGGVLDVIDSVLFAAPVAYVWLTTARISPL
jgi:phosphatidate cytidylyltransferase